MIASPTVKKSIKWKTSQRNELVCYIAASLNELQAIEDDNLYFQETISWNNNRIKAWKILRKKDEVEKENTETICDTDCELHRVSMEEANTYMDEKKKAAPMLANATTLCILSPIPLFLISTFNNGLAIAVACTILLGMVALCSIYLH